VTRPTTTGDFLFRWGKNNNNGESALPEAENTKKLQSHLKTKPRPIVRRGLHHSLHIGLAFKTRPLSAKSVNIMISGNVRIWGIDIGIDINSSW
jgi:hypothetical protein